MSRASDLFGVPGSKQHTPAEIDEHAVISEVHGKKVFVVDKDGNQVSNFISPDLAIKITVSGTDTYIGQAVPGTAHAAEIWQALKVDTDGNVTWADGDSDFDNVATDLTSLSYS